MDKFDYSKLRDVINEFQEKLKEMNVQAEYVLYLPFEVDEKNKVVLTECPFECFNPNVKIGSGVCCMCENNSGLCKDWELSNPVEGRKTYVMKCIG